MVLFICVFLLTLFFWSTVSSEATIMNASSVISQKAIEYKKMGGGEDGGMTADDDRKLARVDDLDELKILLPNVG